MRNQAPSDEESSGMQGHYAIQWQSGYSAMQIVHFKIEAAWNALTPGCITNPNSATDCFPDSSTIQLKHHYCSDFWEIWISLYC